MLTADFLMTNVLYRSLWAGHYLHCSAYLLDYSDYRISFMKLEWATAV